MIQSPPVTAGPAPAPFLELRGVSKSFGEAAARVNALTNVSFCVETGELVALVGPSGSGKSTLIHLAAGLETPSAGTVLVGGTDLATLDDDARSRLRCTAISLVFQAFHLVDFLTAEQNVALPLRFAGAAAREASQRALEALARVGLQQRAQHRPGQLSGGEMQRVAVARALAIRPRLLLADEPTGNLDSRTSAELFELIQTVGEREHIAVLVATHDERAAAQAQRVLELRDGILIRDARRSAGERPTVPRRTVG